MITKKSVVITGASTGIGRACALHMDKLGWRVFAGIRKQADGRSLQDAGSDRLTPLGLDVTDPRSVKAAAAAVADSVGADGLSGLVNNAGVGSGGPIEFLELDAVRAEFEVNFFGVIRATQVLLPLLRRGSGRVVNISSISGLVASPFLSPYSASKFALEAFSDSLRVELSPWNMAVAVIEPGAIDTPIWSKGGDTLQQLLNSAPPDGLKLYGGAIQGMQGLFKPHGISATEVAKAIAHALTSRHPKTRYAIGTEGVFVSLFRLLPDRLRDMLILSRYPKWGGKK